jgi:hypothetical protein
MTIYKIQKKTHLDEYDRSYYNIFTVTPQIKPTEKIHAFLKEIPTKKLSPFDYKSPHENVHKCIQGFLDPQSPNDFLNVEHIEILFNLLIDNGYKIEHDLTTMVKKEAANSKHLVCFASK